MALKFSCVVWVSQVLLSEPELKVEVDPFAATEEPVKEPEKPVEFETTLGFRVKPFEGVWPNVVPAEQWPVIKAPTTFNSFFYKPKTVWAVDGGYLASFNGGEFGSALFYADRNAKRWTRLLAEPVEHCVQVKADCFLISGGLAHLEVAAGAVFFLERMPNGKWSTRKVLEFDFGIPTLIGESRTMRLGDDPEERLFVVSFDSARFNPMLLGIDASGVIYPLGDHDPAKPILPKSEQNSEESKLPPIPPIKN